MKREYRYRSHHQPLPPQQSTPSCRRIQRPRCTMSFTQKRRAIQRSSLLRPLFNYSTPSSRSYWIGLTTLNSTLMRHPFPSPPRYYPPPQRYPPSEEVTLYKLRPLLSNLLGRVVGPATSGEWIPDGMTLKSVTAHRIPHYP